MNEEPTEQLEQIATSETPSCISRATCFLGRLALIGATISIVLAIFMLISRLACRQDYFNGIMRFGWPVWGISLILIVLVFLAGTVIKISHQPLADRRVAALGVTRAIVGAGLEIVSFLVYYFLPMFTRWG